MVVQKYTFKYNRIIVLNTLIQKLGKYDWRQILKNSKLMFKYMKTQQDLIKLNGCGKWFKEMYLIKYITKTKIKLLRPITNQNTFSFKSQDWKWHWAVTVIMKHQFSTMSKRHFNLRPHTRSSSCWLDNSLFKSCKRWNKDTGLLFPLGHPVFSTESTVSTSYK